MDIGIAVLAGLVVGLVVGALGAGGGILAVPTLVYALGQDPHDAAASSLVIVAMTSLVSLTPRWRSVKWKQGSIFGALTVIGSFIGAQVSLALDPDALMVAFSVVLAAVATVMARRVIRPRTPVPHSSLPILIVAATLTGLFTGFFGVGGGFLVVPMLVVAMGFTMKDAATTSLFVMVIVSIIGLVARIGSDVTIDFPVVLAFGAASMTASLFGERLTRRASERTLTAVFCALLAAVSIVMMIGSLPKLLDTASDGAEQLAGIEQMLRTGTD